MPNRLIKESSPYLLQHANNPVDWFPWGEEALQKAKEENKPILVSIGYAACHWCHVMEKESFEDEETAALMNKLFVNIKIDREERPDLDHIYMDAVQSITGSGGWPLNVFLTPEAKPFYGGTYFPPVRAFNRPSWKEILLGVSSAFNEKRNEINAQAENLTTHLLQSNSFGIQNNDGDKRSEFFTKEKLHLAFQNIMKNADREWGGFGKAPKFPQTFVLQFLFRYHYVTGNIEALDQAILSLDKMIEGGIYDQLGGGFARYSTDEKWLVPHFEKMLYDNALLISVLSEAFQLTKKPRYKEVIEETMAFIRRELMHESGGFFSSLDADSEGEEGKFYVWKYDEVQKLLGKGANLFCEYFDITEQGNWQEGFSSGEAKNILRLKKPLEKLAEERNISHGKLKEIIQNGRSVLLEERNKRIRPALDDKIILGWNALMNIACSKAFAATGNEHYREMAVDNMQFVLKNFISEKKYYHTWKNNEAKTPAFLDDLALLIKALLHLQQIAAHLAWLEKAKQISEDVIKNFSDEENSFFYFTAVHQTDIIIRKKEVYDGAIPSGNATMLTNLYHLAIYYDLTEWKQRVERVIMSLGNPIVRYPASFGVWLCLLQEIIDGTKEIVVVGEKYSQFIKPVLEQYFPHKVFMATAEPQKKFPLLADKQPLGATLLYWCQNYSCLKPVSNLEELLKLIKDQE